MAAHHHLPPLFHLPLLLAWLVSVGPPNSTERNKTSSKTERYPDFALENMSKSCLAAESISHDRVPCESGAAAAHGPPRVGCHPQSRCCQPWGLWSHHAACAEAAPPPARLRSWLLSLPQELRVKPHLVLRLPPPHPDLHHLWKLCLTGARGKPSGERTSLPRDGTAQRRSAQCIGTRSRSHTHTLSHTHRELSPPTSSSSPPLPFLPLSLSPSHAPCCCCHRR